MLLKDISFPSPTENILFDEVLLDLAEQGKAGEALRFWESPQVFIVLGRMSYPSEDIHRQAVFNDKIPVLRRASGGGTVLQGKGCLNYTLILSKERHPEVVKIKESYQFILGKIIQSLRNLNVAAEFKPISDLAVGEQKISGNAQKRGKKFILHHGTILYDFDLRLIEKYLKVPKSIPEYRQGRAHLNFVTNVSVKIELIKKELMRTFAAVENEHNAVNRNAEEKERLKDFIRKKEIVVDLEKL